METNLGEFTASNSTWLTQLQDIIELVGTEENQAKSSEAQHTEGLRFILCILSLASNICTIDNIYYNIPILALNYCFIFFSV